jgi:hypothetical protein
MAEFSSSSSSNSDDPEIEKAILISQLDTAGLLSASDRLAVLFRLAEIDADAAQAYISGLPLGVATPAAAAAASPTYVREQIQAAADAEAPISSWHTAPAGENNGDFVSLSDTATEAAVVADTPVLVVVRPAETGSDDANNEPPAQSLLADAVAIDTAGPAAAALVCDEALVADSDHDDVQRPLAASGEFAARLWDKADEGPEPDGESCRAIIAALWQLDVESEAGVVEFLFRQWSRRKPSLGSVEMADCAMPGEGYILALAWLLAQGWEWDPCAGEVAAAHDYTNVLAWIHDQGHSLNLERCAIVAAGLGRDDALNWLVRVGCPLFAGLCTSAVLGGHLSTLAWLHLYGCPIDGSACAAAAGMGDVDTLLWLRKRFCPWDSRTCATAARKGQLVALQWAHANGCPWDEWTCAEAAKHGHLNILAWARSQGAPWRASTGAMARQSNNPDIVPWLERNSYPREWLD